MFSLFNFLVCLKRKTRRINVLSLRQRRLLEASRDINVFVIIVARMTIRGGITRNILQV
jgi:hypothetical protein